MEETPSRRVMRRFVDTIEFSGHPLVSALHPTTIEVTKEPYLSRRGDCVIGVSANKSVVELMPEVKRALKTDGSEVTIRIIVSGNVFEFRGRGDARLTLRHPSEVVLRKSSFVSDRTLMISATAAAKDLPRSIVDSLKKSQRGSMEVGIRTP